MNTDYNTILLFISLIFTILILMSILFGCKYNYYYNYNNIEKFTDNIEEIKENPISTFEQNFLSDLSRGLLSESDIEKLIIDNKLKEENIMNILNNVKNNDIKID